MPSNPKCRTLRMMAKAEKRDYITPEDIGDAAKQRVDPVALAEEVLFILGRCGADLGAEDSSLCAFVAWKYMAKNRKRTPTAEQRS